MNLEEFLKIDINESTVKNKNTDLSILSEVQRIFQIRTQYVGKISEDSCPKCKEKGTFYCGRTDLGGVDYYDNYFHLCLNCLYAEHHEDFTQMGSNPPEISCWFGGHGGKNE